MPIYRKSIRYIIEQLKTSPENGLSQHEAEKRLKRHGANILPQKPKPPLIFIFISQFQNILVVILLIATVISLILGDTLDAAAIFTIVIVNATIGFVQEVKAQKTLDSLKEKEQIYSLVVRNGKTESVPAVELVTGDILILEEGTKVPSDARIIESFSLKVDESILTGESKPVYKHANVIVENVPLGDQKNLVFKDTKIVLGRGKAVVYATGINTEIGKIAQVLKETVPAKTPLTVELEKVGHMLTLLIGGIAILVFTLNYLLNTPLVDSLLLSISLAVAAIPEGLPAIVTIVLSLGVKRLAEKKTIVKKLPAVETLGAIRIIATDKTGTLTANKINVVKIILSNGDDFTVEGEGYKPTGIFYNDKKNIINPANNSSLETLLKIGVLASNATVKFDREEILGDTTEGSLIVAAARANLNIDSLSDSEPKIFEVPFSSERKMMSVIVEINETADHYLYAKGAPEIIVEKCSLSADNKKKILLINQKLAQQGLRVLAFARRYVTKKELKNALENNILSEDNLEYMGLIGMQDTLRPEVKLALQNAKLAGINTIMITGDHKITARSIALEANIISADDPILTDEEVQKLSLEEIARGIRKNLKVFARISPLGKLKIIEAIKTLPHTQVAVTGDGVNDAPAMQASHIGVAMGKTGTDLTREVADIVITDDNYATIVDAIKEGRVIFANLVKFTRYLISCNLSEVIVVTGGIFFGSLPPLIPIQILWINLITDGFPALALGMDPPEFDVMKKPPRDLTQGILHKKRWFYMTLEGSIMGLTTLALFAFAVNYLDYKQAQTMAFTTLAFSQLTHAFNNRSTRKSLFQIGFFGNKPLIIASAISVFLQILVNQTSLGNLIFKTVKLDLNDWLFVTSASLLPFLIVEIKKQLRFRILP